MTIMRGDRKTRCTKGSKVYKGLGACFQGWKTEARKVIGRLL